jgi:hypothetical protein
MSFGDFNFTSRTRCPYCKTRMIIIDNKVISCPLCDLEREAKSREFDEDDIITQDIF